MTVFTCDITQKLQKGKERKIMVPVLSSSSPLQRLPVGPAFLASSWRWSSCTDMYVTVSSSFYSMCSFNSLCGKPPTQVRKSLVVLFKFPVNFSFCINSI